MGEKGLHVWMREWVLKAVLAGALLVVATQFVESVHGGQYLFPYRTPQVGVIPVSVGAEHRDSLIRIWEESVTPSGGGIERKECLVVGNGISCGDMECRGYLTRSKDVVKICNYTEFSPDNRWIPSFIDEDLPMCKVFNLSSVPEIKSVLSEGLFNSPRACLCSKESGNGNLKVLSPSSSGDTHGGWRLELFQDDLEIPNIYPFNRFIVDVRVLVNPGWNLEFILSSSLKINKAVFSIVSLKKDDLCQGFPEDGSLQILQPTNLDSKGDQLIQTYLWNPKRSYSNSKDDSFDYQFPANQLTTTHYYICYYHHQNSNSGHLLGSVYFRLNPEDAAQTFSLLLLAIIFAPLVLFSIYIVISSKHKTSIDKLQGYVLFENRSQVSLRSTLFTSPHTPPLQIKHLLEFPALQNMYGP
ncbi:signal peptide and transmembrane domain-containing protein [Cryptosporidium canis]|uniref:Signal peptide and transmembrane domain-containing protein n=1 Tax=Cryptosporidium canis TaxID=195482 RepID=A0ABQ8PBW9_9CRYT|nr:signal peptide and transmembrane domain-containing protein [Cryptosporidium canis]KAJ1615420.1 signal peptide and transmembrane domain-containing protein [Cryptosporidium canis]